VSMLLPRSDAIAIAASGGDLSVALVGK
jgi:hypothetical protein